MALAPSADGLIEQIIFFLDAYRVSDYILNV